MIRKRKDTPPSPLEKILRKTVLHPRSPVTWAGKKIIHPRSPVTWAGMKLAEGHIEFQPDFVADDGSEQDANLKPPIDYELKGFSSFPLHLETGEHVTAWYKAPKPGFPTIVYCPGAFGALDARRTQLREFAERDFGVIAATYPGQKMSNPPIKGKFPLPLGYVFEPEIETTERNCIETARAMTLHLIYERATPPESIRFFGESLGSYVALRTAYELENGPLDGRESITIPAVICWAPFTSLVARAAEDIPQFPGKILMENRFENDRLVPLINYDKTHVLFMHGADDKFTKPFHSEKLQELAHDRPTRIVLKGCNHGFTLPGSFRKDPDQLRSIANCAQEYLHDLGLSPPITDRKKNPNAESGFHDLCSGSGTEWAELLETSKRNNHKIPTQNFGRRH